ncbi:hypothetical protein N9W17_04085 [Jannaschia sp.]|nr:hypothetical protein [Jannaschia sp.]
MTLSVMVAAHDDGALAALASKGLLRRAARDLDAGKAEVLTRNDAQAEVRADGMDVVLPAAGPAAATCPCPASGICRHVVLALLALRGGEAVPVQSAADDLSALTDADLRAFAGADWDAALRQAHASSAATREEDGATLRIHLPDASHPVAFLPGQGLPGAVFKGPPSSRRRVIAAAAMIARGGALPAAAALQTLDPAVLDDTLRAIAAIVAALPDGGATLAEDRLFDLSISARAAAAPRLTGLLRSLTRQASAARARHFAHRDEGLLATAATAYALTLALRRAPQDAALTGTLARRFTPAPDRVLTILGTRRWTAPSGARGLRVHAFDPDTGTWHETGQARAAGTDPSFSPETAYGAALWALGPPRTLAGRTLRLTEARMAPDGAIAWDDGTATEAPPAPLAAQRDWTALRADLAARAGAGLRRSPRPLPVLIAPHGTGPLAFDDIAQHYRLPVLDRSGQRLDLSLPAAEAGWAVWLSTRTTDATLLCEAVRTGSEPVLTPVTLHGKDGAQDLTFGAPPRTAEPGRFGTLAATLRRKLAAPAPVIQSDPVAAFGTDALMQLTDALLTATPSDATATATKARALGLPTLAAALTRYAETGAIPDALAAAYLASEVAATA